MIGAIFDSMTSLRPPNCFVPGRPCTRVASLRCRRLGGAVGGFPTAVGRAFCGLPNRTTSCPVSGSPAFPIDARDRRLCVPALRRVYPCLDEALILSNLKYRPFESNIQRFVLYRTHYAPVRFAPKKKGPDLFGGEHESPRSLNFLDIFLCGKRAPPGDPRRLRHCARHSLGGVFGSARECPNDCDATRSP